MRASRAPAIAAGFVLLLSALAAPLQAQACNSVGVSPPYYDLQDAQAGQSYVATFSVQNPCPYGRDVVIGMDGETGGWTTTLPSGSFHLDPVTTKSVDATIKVPAGTGPGKRIGHLSFIGQAVQTGSGNQVATGYAVQLNVTVGGVAITKLLWVASRAPDATDVDPPVGFATARNDGNVQATARMQATATLVDKTDILATGTGALTLKPGEQGEFRVNFTQALPVGQYTMHFQSQDPAGYSAESTFRVAPPGAPTGTLLGLLHKPFGTAGEILPIEGRFRNDGNATIRSAQLKAEVKSGETILAALQSDALAVPPGATVNLTIYWTPTEAGTFTLSGHVLFDGYTTPDNSSPLNVQGGAAAGGIPYWVWILVALLVLLGLVGGWYLGTRRKGRDKGPGGGKGPKSPPQPPPQSHPHSPAQGPKHPARPFAGPDARSPQPWQRRK